jgi:hypothetical protein
MTADILLASPLYLARGPVERRLMTPYFPLGLLFLVGALREAGFSVGLYDATFRSGPEDFSSVLAEYQPPIVGLQVLSTVRKSGECLARVARESDCLVVVGGPDPMARPESYLASEGGGPALAE